MQREHAFTAARWLFALLYFGTGVVIALSLFGLVSPPQQPTVPASAFTAALTQSRFIDPLLSLCFLVGGAALALSRTAPLGIVVLAPAVVVIFCFHLVLSGQWVWGSLNLAWLALLAWHYRAAYRPLWSHSPLGAGAQRGA